MIAKTRSEVGKLNRAVKEVAERYSMIKQLDLLMFLTCMVFLVWLYITKDFQKGES
jgi:hypothetical protein